MILKKIKNIVKWVVVLFFSTTILAVVAYRFIPVYVTPLMFIRCFQQVADGESITLHHHWVSMDKISPHMPVAVMASEDARFLKHHGFDFNAIESAAKNNARGGKDANASNSAGVELFHRVLIKYGVNPNVCTLLPATHEATGEMLNAVGYIDLCIPRGGKKLINFVRDTAKVPVIETGAGVVHCYFDKDGDLEMGKRIITNAKCRRVSVCNALDCLLIHENRLSDLPALCEGLAEKQTKIHADTQANEALKGHYPDTLLYKAEESEAKMKEADANVKSIWNTEWLSMQMGIKTVASEDEALDHIAIYGSGHSESIVSNDEAAQKKFQMMVDAACVYVNAPTSFTDGAQFGLGAEIGISTQKLGARGPMALEEITTYKWLITGNGQTRN